MVVQVRVDGQTLRWYDRPPQIADHSIKFVRFQFICSPDWEGYEIAAQFTQTTPYSQVLTDGYCDLPAELVAGNCSVSLFGYKAGKPNRATAIPLHFLIQNSGFVSSPETPIPPTPDLYAQYLARVDEAVANSAPKIRNGTWWVWNASVGAYVDTKVPVSTAEGGGGVYFETDDTLNLSEEGVLSVNVMDKVEQDNANPVSSGAVYDEFSKAVALLKTI